MTIERAHKIASEVVKRCEGQDFTLELGTQVSNEVYAAICGDPSYQPNADHFAVFLDGNASPPKLLVSKFNTQIEATVWLRGKIAGR